MASRTGVFIIIRALLGTGFSAFVPIVAGLAAGFIPEAGAFFISAGIGAGAAGESAEVGTSLAVVIHRGCSRQTSRGSGFSAHGSAVHISVTGIGFDFVMFLTVTAGADFAVLNVSLGDGGIIISGTGVATGTVSIVV